MSQDPKQRQKDPNKSSFFPFFSGILNPVSSKEEGKKKPNVPTKTKTDILGNLFGKKTKVTIEIAQDTEVQIKKNKVEKKSELSMKIYPNSKVNMNENTLEESTVSIQVGDLVQRESERISSAPQQEVEETEEVEENEEIESSGISGYR